MNNLSRDSVQSRTIDFLRFPMAALVVFCHQKLLYGFEWKGGFASPDGGLVQGVQVFFSEVIPHIAVPLFVFFSGFLFFLGVDFSKEVYLKKLKKRSISLLVPYLIWCSIAYLLTVLKGGEFSLLNWLQGFWDTGLWYGGRMNLMGAFPADMPLWFVRDLMVMVILSPLVWCIIRYCKWIGVLVLGVWWYSHWMPKIPGLSSDIVFFFTAGAWFSINREDFLPCLRKVGKWLYIPALLLMVADFLILNHNFTEQHRLVYNWPVFNAFIISGVITCIAGTSYLVEKKDIRPGRFWAPASMFLFATHALYMSEFCGWFYSLTQPASQAGWLLFYFANIILIIALSLGVYALLRKALPKLTAVLTGGR